MNAFTSVAIWLVIGASVSGFAAAKLTKPGRWGGVNEGMVVLMIFGTLLWPIVLFGVLPFAWVFKKFGGVPYGERER